MPTKTQHPKKNRKKSAEWVDLGVRGTPSENETINAAARLAKQSRCQFVLQAAIERAAQYSTQQDSK
jgi:uncharacterized protein (DUF1778 family)